MSDEETALVELPDGAGLRRGLTAVPAGSRVWSNARVWAQNIRPEMWFPYLQTAHPELCNLEDVQIYQQAWRIQHVWPALLALATVPETAAQPTEPFEDGENEMAKAEKKARKTKDTNGSARASRLNKAAKIKVLAEKNPKREGTKAAAAFALYKSGMLVSTFLEKGGRAADIAYDVKHGHISLETPVV